MRLTKIAPLFAGAVAAGLGAASTAHASLTVDVRITAVSVGGSATITVDKKTYTNPVAGATVTMNVWAQVRGTDPSKSQTLQSVTGSFLSSTGGHVLNSQAAGAAVAAPFQGNSFSAGLVQDLDADGDNDIGSNNQADADNFFRARSPFLIGPNSNQASGDPLGGFTSASITGGTEYKIAQLKFIVGAVGGTATINFRPDAVFEGAVWAENADENTSDGDDGTVYTYQGGTTLGGDTGVFQAGVPVTLLGVPEPTSLGLLGIAGMGLLARRRK